MAKVADAHIIWQGDPNAEKVSVRVTLIPGEVVPLSVPGHAQHELEVRGLVHDDPNQTAPKEQSGPPLVTTPLLAPKSALTYEAKKAAVIR